MTDELLTTEEPERHCVYRFYDATGLLLYVGRSCRFADRVSEHRRDQEWWFEVATIGVIHCPDAQAADRLERRLIRTLRPTYNIVHIPPVPPAWEENDRRSATRHRKGEVEPWLNATKLASHLGKGEDWVRKQVPRGLPSSTIGGRLRFKASLVDEWLHAGGASRLN